MTHDAGIWTERAVCGPFSPFQRIRDVKAMIFKSWNERNGWHRVWDLQPPHPSEQIIFIRGRCTSNDLRLKDYIEAENLDRVVDIQLVCKVVPSAALPTSTNAGGDSKATDEQQNRSNRPTKYGEDADQHLDSKEAAKVLENDISVIGSFLSLSNTKERKRKSRRKKKRHTSSRQQQPSKHQPHGASSSQMDESKLLLCIQCRRRLDPSSFNKTQRRKTRRLCEECQRKNKGVKRGFDNSLYDVSDRCQTVEEMANWVKGNLNMYDKAMQQRKTRGILLRNFHSEEVERLRSILNRWYIIRKEENKLSRTETDSDRKRFHSQIDLFRGKMMQDSHRNTPDRAVPSDNVVVVQISFAKTNEGAQARSRLVEDIRDKSFKGTLWEEAPYSILEICAQMEFGGQRHRNNNDFHILVIVKGSALFSIENEKGGRAGGTAMTGGTVQTTLFSYKSIMKLRFLFPPRWLLPGIAITSTWLSPCKRYLRVGPSAKAMLGSKKHRKTGKSQDDHDAKGADVERGGEEARGEEKKDGEEEKEEEEEEEEEEIRPGTSRVKDAWYVELDVQDPSDPQDLRFVLLQPNS
eukprot:jgi/Bigna1/78883/fgenesh1_pg.58_\